MADDQKRDDVEELDIAPMQRDDDDKNRDRSARSDEMPREDADQNAQVRQAGDGNVHLGSGRDPSAETTEARLNSTFDNQDTLDAVSRDSEEGDGVAEGADGEDVGFDGAIARGDRQGDQSDEQEDRGGEG